MARQLLAYAVISATFVTACAGAGPVIKTEMSPEYKEQASGSEETPMDLETSPAPA